MLRSTPSMTSEAMVESWVRARATSLVAEVHFMAQQQTQQSAQPRHFMKSSYQMNALSKVPGQRTLKRPGYSLQEQVPARPLSLQPHECTIGDSIDSIVPPEEHRTKRQSDDQDDRGSSKHNPLKKLQRCACPDSEPVSKTDLCMPGKHFPRSLSLDLQPIDMKLFGKAPSFDGPQSFMLGEEVEAATSLLSLAPG